MKVSGMRVIADQDLANVETLADRGFELTLMPGRDIDRSAVGGHDALLVRSITRVDASLLEGSGIRFVGTATSGLDHIDADYLRKQSITLTHAGGSNANAVVDYCLGSMASLGVFAAPVAPSIGIIGFGHVGSRLYARLAGMGIAARICDPLVAETLDHSMREKFSSLHELRDCDVVTVHVPLTMSGDYPTIGMIDAAFLSAMKPGAVLIHTARGGVVNETALLAQLHLSQSPVCVFDVWENEPHCNAQLIAAVELATPHIAGYSRRAKQAATEMIFQQLEAFLIDPQGQPDQGEQGDSERAVRLQTPIAAYPDDAPNLASSLASSFDLQSLSIRFKSAVSDASAGKLTAAEFDAFRVELRGRSEFSEIEPEILLTTRPGAAQKAFLAAAGFLVKG